MLVLRIIGCVLVVCSCSGIGIYFSTTLKDRLCQLREIQKILLLLRGDIRYANTPLSEALYTISVRHEGELKAFLRWVSEELEKMEGQTISQIWKKGIDTKLKGSALSKKDLEAFLGFGKNLGYLDKDMQLSTIDLYVETIAAEVEEASRTIKEKSYLYNSLGVMVGIFLTIILI